MNAADNRPPALVDLSDRREGDERGLSAGHLATPTNGDDQDLDDYRDLVVGARNLATVGFASKAVSSLLFALFHGATIEIRRFFGWIPYLGIRATRPVFADVVTSSSVVMTIAVIVALVVMIRRPGALRTRRLRAAGSFMGPLIVALTLLLEFVRHLRNPPAIDLRWAALCLGALAVSCLAGAVMFPRDRRLAGPRSDDRRPGEFVHTP